MCIDEMIPVRKASACDDFALYVSARSSGVLSSRIALMATMVCILLRILRIFIPARYSSRAAESRIIKLIVAFPLLYMQFKLWRLFSRPPESSWQVICGVLLLSKFLFQRF